MQAFFIKHGLLIFGLFVLLTYSSVVSSSREPVAAVVAAPVFSVQGDEPRVSASAFAVFDVTTGKVFASRAADQTLPIASITKLATAAALMDTADTEAVVTIREVDVAAEGRAGKLAIGEEYTVRELLFPLLLESSNDAAAALERVKAGELTTHMTEVADAAGMNDTVFADASGLSDRNVSTTEDLQRFLTYLASEYPHVLDITQLTSYVGEYSTLVNNSPVLDDAYVGGKHGFTEAAGRTLAALYTEEVGGVEHTFGYVLLGSDDLRADTAALRAFVRDSVRFE